MSARNWITSVGQRWKWVSGSWVMGQMGHHFGWVTWVMSHSQWPIDPWWNNCAVACNFKYTTYSNTLQRTLFLADIKKLLSHSIKPIIIAGGLILIYDYFALRTDRVVQYHHATPPPSPMRRMKWCNSHGSWVMWVMGQLCDGSHGSRVTKDDPFPSLPWARETIKRFIVFCRESKSKSIYLNKSVHTRPKDTDACPQKKIREQWDTQAYANSTRTKGVKSTNSNSIGNRRRKSRITQLGPTPRRRAMKTNSSDFASLWLQYAYVK